MKKIILLLVLLVSLGSYSQNNKKCDCVTKSKVIKHKKKPVKKVVPIVIPKAECCETNTTINNTYYIQNTTNIVKKDTVAVNKPIHVKEIGPEIEVYGGVVAPRIDNARLGYMVGANAILNLYNPNNRTYLTKYLIGFELSGYKTNPITTIIISTPTPTPVPDCNCTPTPIGGFPTDGKYVSKQDVTALSLNFGVEVYKGWFLLGGVSSYKHKEILNNETSYTYRNTYIDAGIKKFIRVGSIFVSPTLKFNPEVTSFGVGFSYYKQ